MAAAGCGADPRTAPEYVAPQNLGVEGSRRHLAVDHQLALFDRGGRELLHVVEAPSSEAEAPVLAALAVMPPANVTTASTASGKMIMMNELGSA